MRVGIDIDGVLANFEQKYAPLLTKISGIEFPRLGQPDWPDTWYWDREAGVTKEQEAEAWTQIKESIDFWYQLPVQEGARAFYYRVASCPPEQLYFVTNRIGLWAQDQTAQWLEENLGVHNPAVIVSANKGAICKALQLDLYIDDKNENCTDVRDNAPDTHGYMLARPWNEQLPGIPRLASLEEFATIIEEKWKPEVTRRMAPYQETINTIKQVLRDSYNSMMARELDTMGPLGPVN